MNGCERVHSLESNHNPPVHHKVNAKSALPLDISLNQWDRLLTLEWNEEPRKIVRQALLVCRFQQTRTQDTMTFDRCADYLAGQFKIGHFSPQRRKGRRETQRRTSKKYEQVM